jgi:hypothetical protein
MTSMVREYKILKSWSAAVMAGADEKNTRRNANDIDRVLNGKEILQATTITPYHCQPSPPVYLS